MPQPPNRVLAPYPARPPKTFYTVRVPENFLVLACGAPAGKKKDGGEIDYRFELRKDDLPPCVVAGRYVDSSPGGKPADKSAASFWTLQPLPADPAAAEQRFAAAWSALQKNFGPLDKNMLRPHIVESPDLHAGSMEKKPSAAAGFPGGALVNPRALAAGLQSDEVALEIERALAESWFGYEVYPAPNAAVGIGEGLPDYATIVVEETSGGEPVRRRRIRQLLNVYETGVQQAAGTPYAEKSIATTTLDDSFWQRRIAAAKTALFFIALEDTDGEAPVRAGLAEVVALLRGKEVGYDDLRAAVEHGTGKNLDASFRLWLYSKGIPQDFRDRYAADK